MLLIQKDITSLHPALEKYMNFNKRGVQAIGSTEADGRYYSAQQGESEREEEEEDKGEAGGENSRRNCNPSPQTVNYNSH